MIDKRPAIIVRCAGAADVIHAVDFARKNGLLVSVRGGGHNIAGNAVCDGGLVIDLSPMKSVRVSLKDRRALVEPGATLGDFDHDAQVFGLATPLGINSTTGPGIETKETFLLTIRRTQRKTRRHFLASVFKLLSYSVRTIGGIFC